MKSAPYRCEKHRKEAREQEMRSYAPARLGEIDVLLGVVVSRLEDCYELGADQEEANTIEDEAAELRSVMDRLFKLRKAMEKKRTKK